MIKESELKSAILKSYRRLAYEIVLQTVKDAYGVAKKNRTVRIQTEALLFMRTEWYNELYEFSNARLSQEIRDIVGNESE